MKVNKRFHIELLLFLFLVCVLVILGCEGEKGPIGPPGTVDCGLCHGDNTTVPRIVAQWENSQHGSGDNIDRNSSSCARCHTSEGFVEYVETGSEVAADEPSAIGCFTCHAPHTNENFDLRTEAAYTLENGAVFDYGEANLCANCHHSRQDVNTYVSSPTTFTSSHWGPHHSVQADMLSGENGYEYSGYTAGYHNSFHTNGVKTVDGCVACHMEDGTGYVLGGHSWNMEWDEDENVDPCNNDNCHAGALEDFDYADARETIEAYLDTLGEALMAAGLVDDSFHPIEDVTTSIDSAGAVWNLLLVEEDRSDGIHNTDYAVALLKSALFYLRGQL